MLIRRIARPLLSTIFIAQGIEALRNTKTSADATRPLLEKSHDVLPDRYARNVPTDAEKVVRVNAALQIGGGALLAAGKAPRLASLVLAGTLVPGNLGQHPFWTESDPAIKDRERKEFLTSLSLLGGLIIAAVDTEGKPSLGWRGRRAAERASHAVASALPVGAASAGVLADSAARDRVEHGLHVAAERGRELAEAAQKRGAAFAEVARERGPELAEAARERGAAIAEAARERGPELAEAARERGAAIAEVARERGPEYAEVARDRTAHLAAAARERTARK
ncbi:DoxX family protein [Antrihabitans sp. YC2-6]|uniref:DoxX family protein n=1 Tax=Antrihabitans sp. YC2-6 TaxID=2799498 RepID=UPI0018F5D40D|nr:DoxX family membrane protein [Antrihabitans sp. YC2-6]MBJ8343074.1 DoxX family protein [Antrihabitans sp. YC2-6]